MRLRPLSDVLRAAARNARTARAVAGFSQEEAAHRAGVSVRQWQRVEAGEATTLRTLVSVAAALELDVSELLGRKS